MKARNSYLVAALLVLLSLLSIFRLFRIIDITFSPTGGLDFHSFWYSGQFIRQGEDPFRASLENLQPRVPIWYVDGKTTTSLPVSQGLTIGTSYPAFVYLFLIPFSFFSWPTAKILWMAINLGLMFLVPVLVVNLFRQKSIVSSSHRAIVCLAPWGLLATSEAIGNGQTSYLVLTLSLVALLTASKNRLVAGIALGVALSKYSLCLPFLLFLLFLKKEYRVVAIAIILQVLGFLLLSVLTKTSFISLLGEYYRIVTTLINSHGINLESLLSPHYYVAYFLVLALTFLAVWCCWRMTHPREPRLAQVDATARVDLERSRAEIIHLHALNLLAIWTLLSFYHGEYDAVVFILFVAMIVFGLANNYWDIQPEHKVLVVISTLAAVLLMSRPGVSVTSILPASLSRLGALLASSGVTSLALLISFAISLWLSLRIRATR